MRTARWWKLAGIAGLAGVTATGVAVARDQRRRTRLEPDEVRERLHARLGRGAPEPDGPPPAGVTLAPSVGSPSSTSRPSRPSWYGPSVARPRLMDLMPSTPRPAGLPLLRLANASFVTDRLVVGGDLHPQEEIALDQALELVGAGVTHVLDARIEWRDHELWNRLPPVEYHWRGIDDRGQRVPPSWFDDVAGWAVAALERPGTIVLTHCHMGINRGPSAGFAVLLALGWDPVEALDAIRTARPVAYVAYAEDALRWHHARTGVERGVRRDERARVQRWRDENGLDLVSVIRRVRESEPER